MKRHVVLSLIAAGVSLLTIASANAWSVATNVPATKTIPGGTAVSPFVITTSGNYYLAANLNYVGAGPAILVEASEVTIDLNGRTLSGLQPQDFQMGILVLGAQDVIVQQGDIDNFAYGVIWLPGSAGVNAKNRVEDVNFNNNQIGVMSESGTSNWVKQCVIDGGDVGVFINDDIGTRVSHSIFEEQQAEQSVGVGTGIMTVASKGNLFDENLIAKATSPGGNTFGIIASPADKVRFDSFVNYGTTRIVPIFGAIDLLAVSSN
jgi:hypothetical protein